MAEYRFEIRDVFGDEVLAEAISLQNVRFRQVINGIGKAGFFVFKEQIPFANEILVPEKTTFYIYRDEVLIWGGLLKDRQKNYGQETLSFTAETFETWLQDRFVDYLQITSPINKALLLGAVLQDNLTTGTFYQNGLSVGTLQSGQTGSIQVGEEFENIDILKFARKIALSEFGFDFEVDANGRLNTYSPVKGTVKENIVLQLGRNIKNIRETITGNEIINRVKAIGENGIVANVGNFGSQDIFRVRERVRKIDDIVSVDLLRDTAEDIVRVQSSLKLNYEIDLPINPIGLDLNDITTGDSVRIIAESESDAFRLDAFKRIEEIEVALDEEFNEQIKLTFFEE